MDANGDGYLTYYEFADFLKTAGSTPLMLTSEGHGLRDSPRRLSPLRASSPLRPSQNYLASSLPLGSTYNSSLARARPSTTLVPHRPVSPRARLPSPQRSTQAKGSLASDVQDDLIAAIREHIAYEKELEAAKV